jgi:hypothetical protein
MRPAPLTDVVMLYYSTLLCCTAAQPEIDGHVSTGLSISAIRQSFESSPEFFANG